MKVFSNIRFNRTDEAMKEALTGLPDLIPEIITQRLYNEGVDSNNKELQTDTAKQQSQQYYSRFTSAIKQRKGQKTAPVTLNDTGDFYNSFYIKPEKDLVIGADFNKKNNHIAANFEKSYSSETNFEKAILDLSDDDKKIFIKELLPNFIKQFKRLISLNIR